MKRLFVVAFVFTSLGLLLGHFLRGDSPAAHAGTAKCSSQNGDVNADGTIDLSDAVTFLGNLFLGSPTELVGLCEPRELQACQGDLATTKAELESTQAALAQCQANKVSELPDTGQWVCYGYAQNQGFWVEVPCDQAVCAGQDGSYATGCPPEGRLTDNGDGTVTDHCTGLMWQKDTADVNGDGQLTLQDRTTWCQALAYCQDLRFAGHDDWRLPNVRELESLADYGGFDPSIDPVFGALSYFYWSSTSGAGFPGVAWIVLFQDGSAAGIGGEDVVSLVRAVRSGR